MGELRDLIAIYGEIDRAVAADGSARERVASLLPAYGAEDDVRWYDDFVSWTAERTPGRSEGRSFPSLDAALADLATITPQGRMRARRLWAITLAAEVFPELKERDNGTSPLARALGPPDTEGESPKRQDLVMRLADTERRATILAENDGSLDAWWEQTLREARANGEIDEDAERLGPRPCTGRVLSVRAPGGDEVTVAALWTEFETSLLTFDQASEFLHPDLWPGCSPLCCRMEDRGLQPSGLHRYGEVVSVDCDDGQPAWTINAELDFAFTRQPGIVAIADYHMSPSRPQDVIVDEGALVVAEIGTPQKPRVRVTTTKRVRFDGPFSGESLGLVMCALGYGEIVHDLIFTCALGGGAGKPLPPPPGAGKRRPGGPSAVDALITRGERAAEACIAAFAEDLRSSAAKVSAGTYKADDLVQDVTRTWLRALRESAAVVDAGVRTARGPDPDAPGDPPPE
jgi:hypothetical protein